MRAIHTSRCEETGAVIYNGTQSTLRIHTTEHDEFYLCTKSDLKCTGGIVISVTCMLPKALKVPPFATCEVNLGDGVVHKTEYTLRSADYKSLTYIPLTNKRVKIKILNGCLISFSAPDLDFNIDTYLRTTITIPVARSGIARYCYHNGLMIQLQ
jgi:hypothetical protein